MQWLVEFVTNLPLYSYLSEWNKHTKIHNKYIFLSKTLNLSLHDFLIVPDSIQIIGIPTLETLILPVSSLESTFPVSTWLLH
jgi:hypothetical protein